MLTAVAGCGDGGTAPSGPKDMSGNYAAFVNDHLDLLTVHLDAANGQLSGFGWSTITASVLPGLGIAGSITGSYSSQNVHWVIHPLNGTGDWQFNGVFESDTLKGEFSLGPPPGLPVELIRVDTVPSGQSSLQLTGGLSLSATGKALFGYEQPGFRLTLALEIPGAPTYLTRVVWERSSPPPAGTYVLGAEGGTPPIASFTRTPPGGSPETLPLGTGTLIVEAANRYALIGRLQLSVTDLVTGLTSVVHASFSAGCLSRYC